MARAAPDDQASMAAAELLRRRVAAAAAILAAALRPKGDTHLLKRQIPHDLARRLAGLPPGRRRVAEALVDGVPARTYPDVAAVLGVSLGTVHQHLRRIRQHHPEAYTALMAERRRQLAGRHE